MTAMRCAFAVLMGLALAGAAQADEAFHKFLANAWPQAQELGVSRATFDAATRGLEPDLSLPVCSSPWRDLTPVLRRSVELAAVKRTSQTHAATSAFDPQRGDALKRSPSVS